MNYSANNQYRLEIINLNGDLVYLNFQTTIKPDSLPGNLPDDAYLVRISGKDDYFFEKLLVEHDC
jgi:hypothetical protein